MKALKKSYFFNNYKPPTTTLWNPKVAIIRIINGLMLHFIILLGGFHFHYLAILRFRVRSSTLWWDNPALTVSAQLLLLEPELSEVLEPAGLFLDDMVVWPSFWSDFEATGVVAWRNLPDTSDLGTFLLGFLFSLANMDWRATKEILCCLGELDPGAALDGLDEEEEDFVAAE